ncbi:MAG: gyrase subunit A protein, partial [Parcubacteria group bacterium GW2011_GWD1_42_9]
SDSLKWVRPTSGEDNVLLVSNDGKSIKFREEDVRATARDTQGVRIMRFKESGDQVASVTFV